MFKRLNIKGWRQFDEIDINFHKNLTILTGANGAGKTTILGILSKSIGWEPQFVSSYNTDNHGGYKYFASFIQGIKRIFIKTCENTNDINGCKLGELEYSSGNIGDLILPNEINNGVYNLNLQNGENIKGVYINSHRPNFPYKKIQSITTTVETREHIFNRYNEFNKTLIYDTYRDPSKLSATSLIKETLASLAIFGDGNPSVPPNENIKKLYEGYINILKIVLPEKLGFEKIEIAVPEVLLCTKTGNFPIDAVSGGIASIIDITWQIYMFGDTSESFIVLLDEPENHLHPELQKNFLGNLIKAFPNVQFVIATHNPFMITSQKDSNVYVLNYNDKNKVYSYQLDYINKAGTSNSILRDVLGIDSSMPNWAEETLKTIIEKYSKCDFNEDNLKNMRDELSEIGLGEYIPSTIAHIVQGDDK